MVRLIFFIRLAAIILGMTAYGSNSPSSTFIFYGFLMSGAGTLRTFGEMSAMSANDPLADIPRAIAIPSASLWRDRLAHTTRPLCYLAPQRAQS